jgi:hypothetical protein
LSNRNLSCVQRLLELVANEKMPESAAEFPVMRKRGFVRPIAKGGGVSHWTVWDGTFPRKNASKRKLRQGLYARVHI